MLLEWDQYTDLFTLKICRYDPIKYRFYAEVEPKESIDLEGFYDITGKVLTFPIVGNGKCKISLGNDKIKYCYIW
jgi:hypothetical protein